MLFVFALYYTLSMTKKRTIQIRLEEDDYNEVVRVAGMLKVSISECIRRWLFPPKDISKGKPKEDW